MIVEYQTFLLFGALGGLARALVGIVKEARKEQAMHVYWQNIVWNIGGSTIIGSIVGLIVDTNASTAVASGYAGIDFLSNLPKIIGKG